MSEPETETPLWAWILLGVAPGLFCDFLMLVLGLNGTMDFAIALLFVLVAMPVVGTIYLVVLGRRYVKAGMGTSVAQFVLLFVFVNALLVGAGCGLLLR